MATLGGPAIPVSAQTTGQQQGGAAIPVAVVTDGRAVESGPALPVYVVTSGPVQGGPALPVVAASAGATVQGGAAIPVYVVSGSLGGSPGVAPVNTVLPVISGTLAVGQLLSTTDGAWTGTAPITYTYQWQRGGVDIGGETANTYTLTASDPGTAITVEVTATNATGSASATSAAVNPSSLLSSLIGYWKLEEASGTRVDSSGRGNDLDVINGAPGNAVGKVANAIQCVAASAQYVERASNSDLQTGDIDFTVAAWVYIDSKGANRALMAKASTNLIEYSLLFTNAVDRFQFFVSSNGTGFTNNVLANNLGAPSLATWYFVVAWHDSGANTINIQANDGVANSGAYALGLIAATGVFRVGSTQPTAWQMDGRIDEVGFWKRVLTAAERTALYNGGNGTTFPF